MTIGAKIVQVENFKSKEVQRRALQSNQAESSPWNAKANRKIKNDLVSAKISLVHEHDRTTLQLKSLKTMLSRKIKINVLVYRRLHCHRRRPLTTKQKCVRVCLCSINLMRRNWLKTRMIAGEDCGESCCRHIDRTHRFKSVIRLCVSRHSKHDTILMNKYVVSGLMKNTNIHRKQRHSVTT